MAATALGTENAPGDFDASVVQQAQLRAYDYPLLLHGVCARALATVHDAVMRKIFTPSTYCCSKHDPAVFNS